MWIISVAGPKWTDLIKAAEASDLGGFATTLTAEIGSRKEPQKESVKRAQIGGNYKHNYYEVLCAVLIVHNNDVKIVPLGIQFVRYMHLLNIRPSLVY